jgi:exodeoxyribonuclease V alpha subunit
MQTKHHLETITGLVERVTYHNEENGYAVLKVKVQGKKDLVTIVGVLPAISVGEDVHAQGKWYNDFKHGVGFKAEYIRSIPPNTLEGIEKYLGSGLIRGIGAHFAKRLVSAFGKEVFDVIENYPKRLGTVEGIGRVRANSIVTNWADQKIVREIMVFLQSHGVSTSKATRIYRTYGEEAIKVVTDNPYKLAKDIKGIGFISADKIAMNLGIEAHSLIRARAGINHVLMEGLSAGHCCLPVETLLNEAEKILAIPISILRDALTEELRAGELVQDTIDIEQKSLEMVFLAAYYIYEKNIAFRLKLINTGEPTWSDIDTDKAIEWVEEKLAIKLADNQKRAIRTVTNSKITVITGGPGTGKTTLVNSILTILKAKNIKIKLCAPTGRAAKRLSETTALEAFTIHRLLQFDPSIGGFKHDHNSLLDCDLLVIDEASMVDVQLMNSLLKAIPEKAGIILVGDVDQLPSVGPGNVLKDIINSNLIPIVILNQIFRQAQDSDIITNAHLINQGLFPKMQPKDKETDFYFIEIDQPENIVQNIIKLVKERVPRKFGFNAIKDIQVLSPMQIGGCGVKLLNSELQKSLNPNWQSGITKFGQTYSAGDKVMQIENNYNKEVYNGDIGFISKIGIDEQEVLAVFDDREIKYSFSELDELTLSYATTIHKSQGSEYPAVIIPLSMQHFVMLKKNLIYTGITRGRKLVVIVGQKKALSIAIKNKKSDIRYCKLREWLVS